MSIRPAELRDVPEIAQLILAASHNPSPALSVSGGDDWEKMFRLQRILRERVLDPRMMVVVLEDFPPVGDEQCGGIAGLAVWRIHEFADLGVQEDGVLKRTERTINSISDTIFSWFFPSLTKPSPEATTMEFLHKTICQNHFTHTTLELSQLVVHPSFERRGAGRMLNDWGKDFAARHGLEELMVLTIGEVEQFYLKTGFHRVDMVPIPGSGDFVAVMKWGCEATSSRPSSSTSSMYA
ncbi:hypothetical protein RUND412_005514 [Rhizina undulata]